jgi:hypothetical protein
MPESVVALRDKAMLENIWPGQIAGIHFVDWCR